MFIWHCLNQVRSEDLVLTELASVASRTILLHYLQWLLYNNCSFFSRFGNVEAHWKLWLAPTWVTFFGRQLHTLSLVALVMSSTRTTGDWQKFGWMNLKISFISYPQVSNSDTFFLCRGKYNFKHAEYVLHYCSSSTSLNKILFITIIL